ncbi:MAG: tetratricopeptide repeat protein [Tahibacter sp.]
MNAGTRATVMSGLLVVAWRVLAAVDDPLVERCHALQQQPVEAITACEAAFQAHASDRNAELAQEMLLRRSDAELATGEFAAAERSLDRAAALPGADDAWMSSYRLQRRRGILAYRRGQFAQALSAFRATRDLAAANGDAQAEGRSWNDLGNALRRIGSYREALEAYLASLQKKRDADDSQLGALMTNLGDLYRDLDDATTSRDYYLKALELHRQRGRTLDVAHTQESLATLALDTHDEDTARDYLQRAAETFRGLGARSDGIRVAARIARMELARTDFVAARAAIEDGQQLSQMLHIPLTPDLALQAARLALHDDDAVRAEGLLVDVLSRVGETTPERVALLKLRAETSSRLGHAADAYVLALEYQQADAALRDAEHDRRLEQLRVRFDVAEKDRAIDSLGAENRLQALTLRQRATQLALLAASSMLVVLLMVFVNYRRREHARLAAVQRETRLAGEAEHFRQAAAALEIDMRRVQSLLDRSDSALIALDSGARVVAANRAAITLFSRDTTTLMGRPLDEFVDTDSAQRLSTLLAQAEDRAVDSRITLRTSPESAPREWQADVTSLSPADGSAVVVQILADGAEDTHFSASHLRHRRLQEAGARLATAAADSAEVDATIARIEADVAVIAPPDADDSDPFRRELVELMVATLAAWEQATRTGAIELAEKSRVWRVAIDDGRLRVRAMERYLSLAKIPRHPRWREVLRTAYYVLAEVALEPALRDELRRRADAVQARVRQRALV